jgi:hypothetical protein
MCNVSAGRLLAVLAVAALTASCSATGGPPGPAPPVTASPSGAPPGSVASPTEIATILKTLKVPGDGEVGFGRGRLWVENRKNHVLSLVDQSTATVAKQIPGVLGGYMAIGDGVMWMSSYVLDTLLRIDLDAGTVQTFNTGPGQAGTNAVVIVGEEVWVANHNAGTIVRVNDRGKVIKKVMVSQSGEHGPQSMTTDGEFIWVSVPGDRAVVQVDPARARVVRRTTMNGPVAVGGVRRGGERGLGFGRSRPGS